MRELDIGLEIELENLSLKEKKGRETESLFSKTVRVSTVNIYKIYGMHQQSPFSHHSHIRSNVRIDAWG